MREHITLFLSRFTAVELNRITTVFPPHSTAGKDRGLAPEPIGELSPTLLTQNIFYDMRLFHSRESYIKTLMLYRKSLVIHSQQMQDRCV